MKDQEIISTIIYTFLAFILLCVALMVFFYFSRKKITQNLLEKKELELKYQKDLTHKIISSQENERFRIAQDLHDDISSKLSILSLNIHLLNTNNLTEKEFSEISNTLLNITTTIMDSARRIAHDLLPPTLEKFGLHAAIDGLCSEYNATKKVKIVYTNNLYFGNMEKEKNLHIFRIIQELINNSLKHGKATEIEIQFEGKENRNTCIYKDNGKGFDVDNEKLKQGLGLRNIKSRLELINGQLKIESGLNKGFKIEFSF